MTKNLHLLCNAHLDPVWLWEWEEGAAEAISTFRVAADFCEEYDGFVFNHNEVILYQWVEEYEPSLFRRIKALVKQGKWHIMGGWYLQPDCNMPSGESFVRQMLLGRHYFKEKFGVVPTTAINFDPFGHTRGLVQLMRKAGYDSYIFCRPFQQDCPLPADDFTWVGYDGSEIAAHRAFGSYLTPRGGAHLKVQKWIDANKEKPVGLVLWGIGNHGGGPSRIDLQNLSVLKEQTADFNLLHSTPEAYFKELQAEQGPLPTHDQDLNAWAQGCYTSQIRIKQKHRLLENEIYMVEKMVSSASMQGFLPYPRLEIREAFRDLMTAEFHDILPGSSIQPVEEASLRLMDHGLEIASRLKARAFFALARGQKAASAGEIPIFIYNPHPHKVAGIFECEFQLPDQNWDLEQASHLVICQDGRPIDSQVEKEASNLNLDWRKRVVFRAELEPSRMNRFDCKVEMLPANRAQKRTKQEGNFVFKTAELEVVINGTTGFIDRYIVKGVPYLKENSFIPMVISDNDDSWGRNGSFRDVEGAFRLMTKEQAARFCGMKEKSLDPVRVIEDGAVRMVVEALFAYGDSFICQTYLLPKQGTEMEVQVKVFWNEKTKMLKLSIPGNFPDSKYLGQVAYGVGELPHNGRETVAQKWVMLTDHRDDAAFTCINDGIYGSDMCDGELRISLLRSAGYSALPLPENPKANPAVCRPLMPDDRFSNRMDQGMRSFRFWFNAGTVRERLEHVEMEAAAHNEKPFALSFYPSGEGRKPDSLILLNDPAVQLAAFKKAEASENYVLRLYNPTLHKRTVLTEIPVLSICKLVTLGSYEVKTMELDINGREMREFDLMEGISIPSGEKIQGNEVHQNERHF